MQRCMDVEHSVCWSGIGSVMSAEGYNRVGTCRRDAYEFWIAGVHASRQDAPGAPRQPAPIRAHGVYRLLSAAPRPDGKGVPRRARQLLLGDDRSDGMALRPAPRRPEGV